MTRKLAFPTLPLPPYRSAIMEAILKAGENLVIMQAMICASSEVTLKLDGSIVTEADIASENTIVAAIQAHAPSPLHLISEERIIEPMLDGTRSIWFVDPLDGTQNYANGSTDYAVLLSEWTEGTPSFSVVHYPALGEFAVAAHASAEWSLAKPFPLNNTVQLCYMRSAKLRQIVTDMGGDFYEDEMESTRALHDVATGAASAAVVLLCGHKSWDLAPLVHLVAASGGCVSDETGCPVHICGPEVRGDYVIAARETSVHRTLVTALQAL